MPAAPQGAVSHQVRAMPYCGLFGSMLKRPVELIAQIIHKMPDFFINVKYLCDLLNTR